MNRTLLLALAAGLATSSLAAQTAPAATPAAAAPAPAAAPAAVPPQAIPAKIAVIAFEQVVAATNEGQRSVQEVQKKFEPQRAKLDALAAEVESLKKQIAALPANASDDQRGALIKSEDAKEKQLNRDAEDFSNAGQSELQEAYGKVAQKVGQAAVKYCNDNGFTMLINGAGNPQTPNPLLWWNPTTDVSQAVLNAYNASSGVAAPTPSAPSATRRPTAPRTAPAARPATKP